MEGGRERRNEGGREALGTDRQSEKDRETETEGGKEREKGEGLTDRVRRREREKLRLREIQKRVERQVSKPQGGGGGFSHCITAVL